MLGKKSVKNDVMNVVTLTLLCQLRVSHELTDVEESSMSFAEPHWMEQKNLGKIVLPGEEVTEWQWESAQDGEGQAQLWKRWPLEDLTKNY